ncbi:MAG: RNA polymerase sigma factor, partial [Planctomyces sp.]
DLKLLGLWREGDEQAASEFYHRHVEHLLRLVQRNIAQRFSVRFDAEDVVQSVMRTVFRKAESGGLQAKNCNELWKQISTIALNKVRNRVRGESRRKNYVRRTMHLSDESSQVSMNEESDAVAISDLLQTVRQRLEPPLDQTLELLLEGWSCDEISERTGLTTRSIQRHRERILSHLTAVTAVSDT